MQKKVGVETTTVVKMILADGDVVSGRGIYIVDSVRRCRAQGPRGAYTKLKSIKKYE